MCCCTRPSIGLEAIEQMALTGDDPDRDHRLALAVSGSNFAGLALPYVGRKIQGPEQRSHCGVRAGRPAPASPRADSPTTSATYRPPHPAGQDAYPGKATASCRRAFHAAAAATRHGSAGLAVMDFWG